MEASWLFTPAGGPPRFAVGNAQNYTITSIDSDGGLLPPTEPGGPPDQGPDDRFDESLIDFSAVKLPLEDFTDDSNQLEDTFQFRRPAKLTA